MLLYTMSVGFVFFLNTYSCCLKLSASNRFCFIWLFPFPFRFLHLKLLAPHFAYSRRLNFVSELRTWEWEFIIATLKYFYVENFPVDVSKDVGTPATRCLPIIH